MLFSFYKIFLLQFNITMSNNLSKFFQKLKQNNNHSLYCPYFQHPTLYFWSPASCSQGDDALGHVFRFLIEISA